MRNVVQEMSFKGEKGERKITESQKQIEGKHRLQVAKRKLL